MEVPGLPAHHDAPPDPGERAGHLLRQEGKIRIRVYWIVEFFGSGSVVTLRVARPRVYTWLGFVCLRTYSCSFRMPRVRYLGALM